MKLDEAVQDQKLSLDVTPLIDIAFILVLFFAVSTSFISGSDLRNLKTDLSDLADDKQRLGAQNATLTTTIAGLETTLAERVRETEQLRQDELEADASAKQMRWMIQTLEQQQLELAGDLEISKAQRRGLKAQLEQAYADFRALDLRLTDLKSSYDKKAETERLLKALLLEREAQQDALTDQLGQAQQAGKALRETANRSQAERESMAILLAARSTELEDLERLVSGQRAQEKLLQKLLAERAAQLSNLEVRLVEAGTQQQRLQTDLDSAIHSGEATAAKVASLEIENLKLHNELGRYQSLAELGEEQVRRLREAQKNLEAGLESDLAANRLGIKRENQRLVVQLSNRILFDSGSAAIKPEGIEVLRKVGEIIKARTGALEVQIGGHTDNVPMGGRSAGGNAAALIMGNNWGLSSARAVNVVRFLEDEVEIDPDRLSAVGYGEHRPVAGNVTLEGRSQNRRIEIVLVPR